MSEGQNGQSLWMRGRDDADAFGEIVDELQGWLRQAPHMKTVGLAEEAEKQGFNKIVDNLLDALAEKGGESGGGTKTGAQESPCLDVELYPKG